MRLSIVIPVYNEERTIAEIIRRVIAAEIDHEKEIIVVDDGSTDRTRAILKTIAGTRGPTDDSRKTTIRVVCHERNRGKGAAIRTGIGYVSGEIVILQDADLEYAPAEYPKLIQPIISGDADVVYGSRFGGYPRRVLYFWHTVGNKLLTLLSNILTDMNLTDMETGYKVFRADVIKSLPLESDRFGIEAEVTAKIAHRGCSVYEVPISYRGRTYAEGKKISWKDGIATLWFIVKYAVFDAERRSDHGDLTLRRVRRMHRYNRWIWEKLSPYTGTRVLEVGSGLGTMTHYLLDRELVVASDINERYLRLLREKFRGLPNIEVHCLDLNEFQGHEYAELGLNTVVCLNVLEHVEDDVRALKELHALLRPEGRLLLIVPAHQRLFGTIDRAIGHYRRYSRAELVAKLTASGFRVHRLEFQNVPGMIGWYLNGRILRRRAIPGIQSWINDLFIPLLRLEDRVNPSFGLSLIAVAQKEG